MKKILLMLTLLVSVFVSANAQTATEDSKITDNWYIGLNGGVTVPTTDLKFSNMNYLAGVRVGNWFTPVLGGAIEGQAFFGKNCGFDNLKTAVKVTNVAALGTINFSNLIGGYPGAPRSFEIIGVVGLGWMHTFDVKTNAVTTKFGLDFALNLGPKKNWQVYVEPNITYNVVQNGIPAQFNVNRSSLGLNIGINYKFKNSNGTHNHKTYDVGAMINEIDRLNSELAKKPTEIEVIKYVEKVVEVPAKTDQVAVAAKNGETWIVAFNTGSAKLNDAAKLVLDQVGNDAIVDVTATASPDGGKAFNQKLSEKRAKAVEKYLTNRGVKVNSAVGKGADATRGKTAFVTTLQ
jgi:outer membrane protein OmpA-like peptidoglycan-associated protein